MCVHVCIWLKTFNKIAKLIYNKLELTGQHILKEPFVYKIFELKQLLQSVIPKQEEQLFIPHY